MPTTRQSCLAELAITSLFAFRRALDETSSDYSSSYSTSYFRCSAGQDVSHTESALQGTELRSQLAPSQDSFWSAQVSATIEVGLRRHHGFIWLVSDSDHLPRPLTATTFRACVRPSTELSPAHCCCCCHIAADRDDRQHLITDGELSCLTVAPFSGFHSFR